MTGRPRLPVNTTGKIHTRKDGNRWRAIANHRGPDGRTRQYERSGPTRTAAENALRSHLAKKAGEGRGRINGNTTMTALAEEYFTRLEKSVAARDRSPGTLRLYRSHWDNHGAPALGELTVAEADVQCIDAVLTELRQASSAELVRKVRAVLSGMLGIAARYKAIPSNPVRDITPIPGDGIKAAIALEPEQIGDLLAKLGTLAQMPGHYSNHRFYRTTRVHPDIADLVLWMLGTSLRIGQALAVHWPWVDLGAGIAAVGPNVVRVKGKGLELNRGTTKTKEQELGLPGVVVDMLTVRREETANPLGPVFPHAFGGLRDPHNTIKELRRALDLAGYPWVTSHVFRKTVATVLDDAGLSARHIADQLSHSRPSMTQDRYMARRSRNSQAVAALDAMFSAPAGSTVVQLRQQRDGGRD